MSLTYPLEHRGSEKQRTMAETPRRSRRASWAFVVAVAGALLGGFIIPILFSLAGIVEGVRARREIKRDPVLKGKHLATAAIVIGTLGFLFWALLLMAGLAAAPGGGAGVMG